MTTSPEHRPRARPARQNPGRRRGGGPRRVLTVVIAVASLVVLARPALAQEAGEVPADPRATSDAALAGSDSAPLDVAEGADAIAPPAAPPTGESARPVPPPAPAKGIGKIDRGEASDAPAPAPPPRRSGADPGREATGPEGQRLKVTPANDLDPAGATVTVTGSGYDTAFGIYVSLCVDQGPNAVPSPCVGGVDMTGATKSSAFITSDPRFAGLATPWGPGGTFEVELNIAAADALVDCLDGTVSCKLVTRADHTASTNRTADVKVPVHWQGQPPLEPDPEPEPATISIGQTEVRAGGTLAVTGGGFTPGEQVQVWLLSDPQVLEVVTADDDGGVAASVTIPADTPAGVHHVELRGLASGQVARSVDLSVLAAAPTDPPPTDPPPSTTVVPVAAPVTPVATTVPAPAVTTLAETGSELDLVWLATALIATGLSAIAGARRLARQEDER